MSTPEPQTLHALIVEDDVAIEALLVYTLKQHGFATRTSSDGCEAWESYTASRPDLLILDWNLPRLDGLELCRKIREADPTRATYVLMSTGNKSPEHLLEALDAGIDDYISKPYTLDLLDVRLRIARQRMHDRATRQKAETAMLHAQEMAAVGTLASGITHEFNTINAILLGNLNLALSDATLQPETSALIVSALDTANRSMLLTRQLLTLVGDCETGLQISNINTMLENMLSILRGEYASHGIALENHLGDVPFCALDPGGIAQVMLHLLMNARDALEGRPEKRITIESGTTGAECYFRVFDTGCGIPESDRDKIFLPFFSRKGEHAVGNTPQARLRGTGLGLSISDTIIRNHGGRIECESAENIGSTFTVRLPLRQLDGSPMRG